MKKSANIIIIDDDNMTNYISNITIRRWNPDAKATFFTSANDALDYLKNIENPKPDILFLDINIGEFSGWDFLDAYNTIKDEAHQNLKIVMLTSNQVESDKERALKNDCVIDYREKPLSNEILNKFLG